MGRFLPTMKAIPKTYRTTQTVFGGIDNREGASDGAIFDTLNLSGEHYPVLAPRRARMIIGKALKPYGIFAHDGLIWVDGDELWRMAYTPAEYDAFDGSGVVLSNNTALLGVDTEAVFRELLRIADGKSEMQNAFLTVTYLEAGLPMEGYIRITDIEVSSSRETVYLSDGQSVAVTATSEYCRLQSATDSGATVGKSISVKFTLTFPKLMPVMAGKVLPRPKVWAAMGNKVVFFPDKAYLDTASGELGSLEATWTGKASFTDGTYGDSPAVLNTIKSAVTEFPFNEGDAVTISVTGDEGNVNEGTFIIRSVSADKLTLTFYENTFKVKLSDVTVMLTRTVPELDFICEAGGRLWGCRGDEIFASKLGDVFNWNSFDGISTDSWSVSVPSAGDFTGCANYLGMPIFFKERGIYKVYGSAPSEFQLIDSLTLGCDRDSAASVAVAGDALFYISRVNVAVYTGSVPSVASEVLGCERLSHGVAGSDGIRYYISCRDGERVSLYVYDTTKNLWYREDSSDALGFAAEGDSLYMLTKDGTISAVSYGVNVPEGSREEIVISECVFAPYTASGTTERKILRKISVRCEIVDRDRDYIELYVRYGGLSNFADGEGQWERIAPLAPSHTNSFSFSFVPRRCDSFSLKIMGRGAWRVHSITREYSVSNNK